MFVDYQFVNDRLLVSYIDESGQIKLKYFKWNNPTQFVATSSSDENKHPIYKTWDGKPVRAIADKHPNRYSVYDFIDSLPEKEYNELFAFHEPEIYFIDIETEITDGGPDPLNAPNKVLNIAIAMNNKVLNLGIKKLSEEQIQSLKKRVNDYFSKFNVNYEFKYIYFESEYDMLSAFFNKLVQKMAVITGWYFVGFDWVYLVNRARKLNIDPSVASPTKRLDKPYDKKLNAPKEEELPKHRIVVDMMDIYKKWDTTVKIKESDTLDFVAEQVIGLTKIHYSGGLQALYENDYEEYVFYNIVDTLLVKHIHEKQKYINILFAISTLAKIRVQDGFSTIRVTEGIFRKPYRDELGVVMIKDNSTYEQSFDEQGDTEIGEATLKGGWVKEPKRGMAMWCSVFDFASLYPTTMRQFNISPEAYKGQKISDKKCIYQGVEQDIEENDIVLLNDAVFKNENSVTKRVLTDIYNDRKKYKKLMFAKKEELKKLEDELKSLM